MQDKRIQLNNGGFTLIELIVSVLIMSTVSLMIVVFVNTSLNIFKVTDRKATLQTEATAASLFLNELLLEAKEVGASGPTLVEGKSAECIYIIDPDGHCGMVVLFRDAARLFFVQCRELRYHEGTTIIDYDATIGAAMGGALLSDDIYSILGDRAYSMSISTDDKNKLITLKLEFRYNPTDSAEDTYVTTLKVVGRNM